MREQERDDLQRLAEAHVVGEDAAEPVGRKRGEPGEARDLVVAQHGRERFRHLDVCVRVLRVSDIAHDAAELLAALQAQAVLIARERVEVHRVRERQQGALAVPRAFFREARILDEISERGELLLAERHERAVLQPVVAALLPVILQDADELVDGHIRALERDLEQVVVAHRYARRELRQALHGLLLERIRVEDVRLFRERGQRLREEIVTFLLVRLDVDIPLLRKAVGREIIQDIPLLAVVAHEDARALRLRGPLVDERVEGRCLIGKDGPRLDALAVVVEIKLRAQRRELEPLEEAPIHLDVGDLLDGRQHPAEKRLDLLAREREAVRVAEGLE